MTEHDTPDEEDIDRGIIEIEQDDGLIDYGPEELWEIAERIRPLEPASLEPAEIEEAASRVAAVIDEYPLKFRVLVEAVRESAITVYFMARGDGAPGRFPDLGYRLSDDEALLAAGRYFDAIWRELENDALRPLPDDRDAFCPHCLAAMTATGTFGQRILPVLLPH
jgi:hypothetical protein